MTPESRVLRRRDSGDFVPLSVRCGNRRKRFAWRVKGWRQSAALRLAPWLGGRTYKAGYLQGLRMAAAAVPGDVNQPALKAIDDVIARVTDEQ